MKILIIENEYNSVRPVFDAAEQLVLSDLQIEKEQVAKSQSIKWSTINSYSSIFIDISLAPNSNLDGYGVLSKINNENPELLPRVAIITGNDRIEEMLKERGLSDLHVKIFVKPLRYKEIAEFIKTTSESQQ